MPDPRSGCDHDLDGLESQFVELRRNRDFKRGRKGSGPTYGKGVTRQQVLAARDALVEALADFQVGPTQTWRPSFTRSCVGCVDEYERLKAREGALDFLDLLVRARSLIRDDAAVRRHFQTRFTRIFVDEFQDTDPLQAELLLLLASERSCARPTGVVYHPSEASCSSLAIPNSRSTGSAAPTWKRIWTCANG